MQGKKGLPRRCTLRSSGTSVAAKTGAKTKKEEEDGAPEDLRQDGAEMVQCLATGPTGTVEQEVNQHPDADITAKTETGKQ